MLARAVLDRRRRPRWQYAVGEVEGSSQNVQQGAVFKKKIHEKNWEPFHSTTSGLGNQWILIFLDMDSCERRQYSVTKLATRGGVDHDTVSQDCQTGRESGREATAISPPARRGCGCGTGNGGEKGQSSGDTSRGLLGQRCSGHTAGDLGAFSQPSPAQPSPSAALAAQPSLSGRPSLSTRPALIYWPLALSAPSLSCNTSSSLLPHAPLFLTLPTITYTRINHV